MKIPYQLTAAVAIEQRYAQMQSAIARPLPRLQRQTIDDSRTLHIACYGPSLRETWQDLRHPILSMSGATKWLHERGITPDYHIDMDPRAHKAMTSLPPIKGVTYLVASVCTPEYFDALAGFTVILWHTVSSSWEADMQWVAEHDPGQLVVSTGSTIGLAAIQLGGLLGFRRFEIHGMDGSFSEDGSRHAGPHAGKVQPASFTWDAGKVTYRTSQIMANAVAETINTVKNFPIISVFHGNGLTQALVREAKLDNACCADETEKRARLAEVRPTIADVPPLPKGRGTVWDGFLDCLEPGDVTDILADIAVCEPRRARAKYNTGTVPIETSVLLRAVCRYYRPEVVVEVGTFIGTSTQALRASRVIYTCDRDNDCVPSTERVLTHPFRTSTEMLREIQEPVDLFFFDGRIQDADIPEILRLSHPRTVFVFDDCNGNEKGVINVARLAGHFRQYMVVAPYGPFKGRSTLGAMLPMRAA
jgi:hypothetical protein